MNWGLRITILYLSFVVLIFSLAFMATKQEWHMVREDYYQAELEQEGLIKRMHNSKALEQPVTIQYESAEAMLRICFPSEMEAIKGKITLYRPSDANEDQEWPVADLDESACQAISLEGMKTGLWRVHLSWESGDQLFYDEKGIMKY